jgi:hypothetical protein
MTWSVRNRLALIAALVLFGGAAGCGDNWPKGGGPMGMAGQGGTSGGEAGAGGASGMDGGLDADANGSDALDAKDAGDAKMDASDAADGKDGAAGSDAGDAGDGKDGAAGSDAGDAGDGKDGAAGSDAGDGAAGSDAGDATGAAGDGGTAGTTGADGGAGSDAGDASDTGTDTAPEAPPPPACYSVSFTKPVDNAQLSAADDKNGDQCADGFQYDVVIGTGAPDGTAVQLFGGASLLKMVTVSGGTATFADVQLASSGVTNLSIQFPSTMPCVDATTKAKVTVDCSVPTCTLSKPIISATHPALNGVPAAQGGDRASANGSPYQVSFEVTTNVADNQNVFLDIDSAAAPTVITTVMAKAMSGKAVFAGVPFPADGTYDVQGRCVDGNGVVGRSAKGSYPVDTTAPDLTVSKPASGDFIGPGGLTAGAFPVCGSTTASDAVGLPASLGAGQQNYCVSTGGTPICKPAGAVGVDTCVNVPCPGDAPFSITVTLADGAGNPTSSVLTGITCSASTPSVQIVTPVSDAPTFTDPSRHLLASTAPQPFRDQNAALPGAQTDVVACASRGGNAALFAGHTGDATLVQVGATVATTAAAPADGCPAGLGFVARFTGVTLPESVETATGALSTATELRVDVTDISSSKGSSAPLDLWVDSKAPTISLTSPANFCGSFHQAFATYNTDLTFTTDTPGVTATITNNGMTDTLTSPTFAAGMATFSGVVFDIGLNHVAAVAKDPAGNSTAMTPVPCDVTVGMAPVVIFDSPTSSNQLCPTTGSLPSCIDDMDSGTPGWQGSLTVHALVSGVPLTTGNITFSVGGANLGSAPLDGTGHATLTGVTFVDGSVTITATTDNIPGNGVGSGQVTVTVDLGPPDAPTGISASVLDRRQTSFQLSWTAPADAGGGPIAGYDVRYAKVAITAANFDDTTVTTAFPYTGSPAVPGAMDGIAVTGLYIETGYFFAVRAVDSAGNRSGPDPTPSAVTSHFNVTILNGQNATDNMGYFSDGTGDFGSPTGNSFTGDNLSDLVVGSFLGKNCYLFFGTPTGYSTTPSVTFTSNAGWYGASVANIGDIDGDGLADIAISSPQDGNGKVFIFSRKNPPLSWGTTTSWPATLADTQANYVITADAAALGKNFGRPIAPVGDFDGDGTNDLAISSLTYGNVGRVVIVKGSSSFASVTLPDATHTVILDGTTAAGQFGSALLGIGPTFNTGPTLLVSARPISSLFAFAGPAAGPLLATGADDSVVNAPATAGYGYAFGFLGALGTSPFAIAVTANSAQFVDIHLGTVATGPFTGPAGGAPAPALKITGPGGNSWGSVNIGGAVPASTRAVSFIGGDSIPDLVLSGQALPMGPRVFIIDGKTLNSMTGTLAITDPTAPPAGVIAVQGLPANWNGHGFKSTVVPDLNGDGFGDFAVGELATAAKGRVAVFY